MPPKEELFLDFRNALRHLQNERGELSHHTMGALSNANRVELAAFAQTWVGLKPGRRQQIARMLVELAEENIEMDFNPLFRYLLDDEAAAVRASAIDGLWEDEDPGLVRLFVGFLRSDPDLHVRAAAADALGRFMLLAEYNRIPQTPHGKLMFEALLATFQSGLEDISVRARAVEALAYSSRAQVRQVIAAAYEEEDSGMRASAVAAMGHSADKYWGKTVAAELESPDARIRFEAARAAGELEYRAAVPRLIELLEDEDREVQSASITSLGQIGGKQAQAALRQAQESDDEVLSDLADEALQELQFASDPNFLLFDIDPEEVEMGEEDDLDEE